MIIKEILSMLLINIYFKDGFLKFVWFVRGMGEWVK